MEEKKIKKPNPAARKRFLPVVKPGIGRLPLELNEETVFKLAQSMLSVESIAIIMGCGKETLYSRFPDVLQRAREGRKQSLSMKMWEKGLIEGDTKMLIWLSKQHLGYKDVMPESATQVMFNVYVNEIPK